MEQRVGYLLKKVQGGLRAEMDRALSERGLTTPQYAALTALERRAGASNAELARMSFVTPQTMIRVLQNLEDAGLIERTPHPSHGRVLQVRLTGSGRRLVATCHAVVDEIEARMLSPLSERQRDELARLLARCAEGLGLDGSSA